MAASPPMSPTFATHQPRPMSVSAIMRPPRSSSRMSTSSKQNESRISDEDGKTSVKVAVRVRPPLQPTDPGYELIPQRFQRSMVQVTSHTNLNVDSPQGKKLFVFDRVFGPEVDQEGIWEYLQESVGSFCQGYNVSLLAYGQSGAGKSYTMGTSGPAEQSDVRIMGVIPRAAQALFEKLSGGSSHSHSSSISGLRRPQRYSMQIPPPTAQPSANKTWSMKATYVEIYNEQLRDLLLPEATRPEERAPVTIREDTKGRILLTGLRQVTINTIDDLLGALNHGSAIRQTDSTAINAKSSRSHAVFSLNLVQQKSKAPQPAKLGKEKRFSMPLEALGGGEEGYITVDSKLHFVDLAGSERLKNTGAQGERAKEGISINAGLASLGKVISQLSSRQAGSHVSYRDSRLTRLLQDSLGGNAITYMIACVTPAEFHLSETLNTVQYAQRARAIQSKPRIQQVSDDGDLRALVDRLRAEIAFLREQVRNSERSDGPRSKGGPQDRSDGTKEKEMELQNQLLDIQENYTALSQRHAKLISEITRARDTDVPDTLTTDSFGDSENTAVERLKRSNSFAEAVEQVVLEYEKTIQSLESSLSSTRSSLSSTESSLNEKESRLAYIETVNQQLQARVQKMMDRESSTETYLHDLEQKLDGHTNGEEKNASIISELRKEIGRVRENEAGCEDYISTLEERLAEADQDIEILQREIERLELIVDRQRSLGKLDSLLHELDTVKDKERMEATTTNGHLNARTPMYQSREFAEGQIEHDDSIIAEHDEDEDEELNLDGSGERAPSRLSDDIEDESSPAVSKVAIPTVEEPTPRSRAASKASDFAHQSPAQSKAVADKLETVQQELFDLKFEHESTLVEYGSMSQNYEAALKEMADLRDQLDEMRHAKSSTQGTSSLPSSPVQRPMSFLADARVSDLKDEGQLSSSRSLSSELSLAGDSNGYLETTDGEISSIGNEIEKYPGPRNDHEYRLYMELERVKKLQLEKEDGMRQLQAEHARLHDQHQNTLELVEELKRDVHKSRANVAEYPDARQLLRRKSSQNMLMVDKVNRSFNSLRKIAAQYFAGDDEAMDTFETNMKMASQELESRASRIQELEHDMSTLKEEIASKTTMINGLTRERASKSASPMDISVVAVMEKRIADAERELTAAKSNHAAREQELIAELKGLNEKLESHVQESQNRVAALADVHTQLAKHDELAEEKSAHIASLQEELKSWQSKHDTAVASCQAVEKELASTVAQLNEAVTSSRAISEKQATDLTRETESARQTEQDRIEQEAHVEELRREIAGYQQTIDGHVVSIAQLEQKHAIALDTLNKQLAHHSQSSEEQLNKHRDIIAKLEQKLSQHNATLEEQKESMSSVTSSHQAALDQLQALREKEAATAAELLLKESNARKIAEEEAQRFSASVSSLQSELESSKGTILLHLDKLQEFERTTSSADQLITQLEQDKRGLQEGVEKHKRAAETLEKEVTNAKATVKKYADTMKELQLLQSEFEAQVATLKQKESEHNRAYEELEQQLIKTFDEKEEASKKLADITADMEKLKREKTRLFEENQANTREARLHIDSLAEEAAGLKSRLSEAQAELSSIPGYRPKRSDSVNSTVRKSASTASLPSPPPAIPLPPLPGPPTSTSPTPGAQPAQPNMSRRPSKDYVVAHMEDQEARIKTLEKQLQAEKALTATLEEALTDCEKTMKRLTADKESLAQRASHAQLELDRSKNESQNGRYSMQVVEDERQARIKAERAREQLEERMQAINSKKKRSFACF